MNLPIFGTFRSGLNTGVATFQGSRLEGVHCITYFVLSVFLSILLVSLLLLSDTVRKSVFNRRKSPITFLAYYFTFLLAYLTSGLAFVLAPALCSRRKAKGDQKNETV